MPNRVGQRLGYYRLIKLLGRGSLTEVYLSEHIRLHLLVAIKVLPTLSTGTEASNFQDTALPLVRLAHPHILRIFDAEVDAGTPFLVMEYLPSGSLRDRYPQGVHLPLTTIVSYVQQIADALQYGHEAKLIHGAIKPENVLLGQHDELLLTDFGIATLLQNVSSQNMPEHATYIAPEQLQGNPCPASDQYALARMICEWLSTAHPLHEPFAPTLSQHSFASPPSLRNKISPIPPDVEEVLSIALEKEPQRRFASIQAFARAFKQASQSDHSALSSPTQQTLPLPQLPFSAFIPARPKFREASQLAPSTYHTSSWVLAVAWSPDSSRIVSAGDDGKVQVWDAVTGNILLTYDGHSSSVFAVKWSPDGNYIASASADGTVQVWNASTGKASYIYRDHSDFVRSVAWSPDGKYLASSGDDHTVHIWKPENTGDSIPPFIYTGHSQRVTALDWSPEGKYLASASDDHTVHVWSAEDATQGLSAVSVIKRASTYTGHSDRVRAVAWSPNGTCIASASDDHTVHVWSVGYNAQGHDRATTGNYILASYKHADWVRTISWSPSGRFLASGSHDHTVQVWKIDTSSSSKIFTYQAHLREVGAVAWSPIGIYIASGSRDETVRTWVAP